MVKRSHRWAPRLHGQSIKTRVEACDDQALAQELAVYTDNPLKQGLKLDGGHQGSFLVTSLHGQSIKTRVEAANFVAVRSEFVVYTDNPLKQGLKL